MEGSNHEPIKRRDLLKWGVAGAALGATEWTFRPLGEFSLWLTSLGLFSEGNVGQRAAVLEKVVTQATDEEGRQRLGGWLKFNGAEAYALSKGWTLTGSFLKHALYGQGQSVNINREYRERAQTFEKKQTPDSFERYLETALEYPLYRYAGVDGYPATVSEVGKGRIKLSAVVFPLNIPDLTNSLNRHTLELDGEFVESGSREEGEGGPFLLGKYRGGVVMKDRYDWDRNNLTDNGETLDVFIQKFTASLGIDAKKLPLPDEWWAQLEQQRVAVRDEEGAALQRRGFIKPFDVKAEYPRLNRELDIKISTKLI